MINDDDISKTVIMMRENSGRLEHEGDYWTKEESLRLSDLFFLGKGITEIAILLQRTEPAVMQQIMKQNLYAQRRAKKDKEPSAGSGQHICPYKGRCENCPIARGCTPVSKEDCFENV